MKETRSATDSTASTRCSTRMVETPRSRSFGHRLADLCDHRRHQALRSARRAAAPAVRGRARAPWPASAARRPTACPTRCFSRSRSSGKQLEHAFARRLALAARHQADLDVLGDRHLGEQPAALRHIGDAGLGHLMRRQLRSVRVPPSLIEPARAGTSPMIAFSVVVLPAPLRPSRQSTSPCLQIEVEPVQHRHLAVEAVEAADGQRAHSSAGVPR